jgi:hypothetical protein
MDEFDKILHEETREVETASHSGHSLVPLPEPMNLPEPLVLPSPLVGITMYQHHHHEYTSSSSCSSRSLVSKEDALNFTAWLCPEREEPCHPLPERPTEEIPGSIFTDTAQFDAWKSRRIIQEDDAAADKLVKDAFIQKLKPPHSGIPKEDLP